jgi:hypothetical protein
MAAGLAWRLHLVLPHLSFDAFVFGVGVGLLPYAVIGAFWKACRSGGALLLGAVATLAFDVLVARDALSSTSSTAGVAILLAPIYATFALAPVLGLIALAQRRR